MELDKRQITAALVLAVFSFTSYVFYDLFVMKLRELSLPEISALNWIVQNPILTSIVLGGVATVVIVSFIVSISKKPSVATKE